MLESLIGITKGLSIAAVFSYTFYRSLIAFFIFCPFALCYPILEKRRKQKERIQTLSVEFQEAMVMLSSSLRAGYSIENAFQISQGELALLYGTKGLMVQEFSYINAQIRRNIPVEITLLELASRSGIEEIQNFAQVFGIAKRSGGDMSKIMTQTAEVIRDKMQVKEEIKTLTASKQLEQKIMSLIPFGIVLYIEASSPQFFSQMYEGMWGRVVMSICFLIYVIAYGLAHKILAIEV